MTAEDRLRELLRDPAWALPAWPDAQHRVRRSARRQRRRLAGAGAAAAAVVTAVALVPVVLLTSTAGRPLDAGSTVTMRLPALGARGFPVKYYPAAVRARVVSRVLAFCPAQVGLQVPSRHDGAAALTALHRFGSTVGVNLHLSDRAAWQKAVTVGWAKQVTVVAQQVVVYSGPLRSYEFPGRPLRRNQTRAAPRQLVAPRLRLAVALQRAAPPRAYRGPQRIVGQLRMSRTQINGQQQKNGPRQVSGALRGIPPPMLQRAVAAGCGAGIVRDTWVIVSSRPATPATPARVSETLFVDRRGRVLLYNSE